MALRSSWAFQMTVVVRIIRAPRWAGPCGQLGGVVAVAAVPATARALKRLASGSVPSRAGISACGGGRFHPRRARPQARPSAGAPRRIRARRTAMTPIMSPLRSCGGDMSSPQKCPSTRYDSSTASDNRRSGRLRNAWRPWAVVYRSGRYGVSGSARATAETAALPLGV
jgi:hypothetical protein